MLVEIRDLVRVFDNKFRAVDGISFSFGDGEVIGFVGPNGAGKTTTMRILATLDEATSGTVLIDGHPVDEEPEYAHRRIGFMPDGLPDRGDTTVHEYLDFFGRAFGMRGDELARAVSDVEDFTGLSTFRDKTLRQLSKGMKQRVSLARALVHDPDLIVMDEPANGLDPRARIELRELVKTLAEDGKTILISSHILSELEEMCTGTVILEQGRILLDRTRRGIAAAAQTAAGQGAADGSVAAAGAVPPTPKRLSIKVRLLGLDAEAARAKLLEMPEAKEVGFAVDACRVVIDGGEPEAADFLAALVSRGLRPVSFEPDSGSLEDLFMSVTKGALA